MTKTLDKDTYIDEQCVNTIKSLNSCLLVVYHTNKYFFLFSSALIKITPCDNEIILYVVDIAEQSLRLCNTEHFHQLKKNRNLDIFCWALNYP